MEASYPRPNVSANPQRQRRCHSGLSRAEREGLRRATAQLGQASVSQGRIYDSELLVADAVLEKAIAALEPAPEGRGMAELRDLLDGAQRDVLEIVLDGRRGVRA